MATGQRGAGLGDKWAGERLALRMDRPFPAHSAGGHSPRVHHRPAHPGGPGGLSRSKAPETEKPAWLLGTSSQGRS